MASARRCSGTEPQMPAFSGAPWLPVPPSAAAINVHAESRDPNSLLAWYKALIRLKKTVPAFENGANIMLDPENTKVLSWMRQATGAPQVVVSVNFTSETVTTDLTLGQGGNAASAVENPAEDAGRTGHRVDQSNCAGAVRRLHRRGEVTGRSIPLPAEGSSSTARRLVAEFKLYPSKDRR